MSKESKPRDLWRQLHQSERDRGNDFCRGCGYYAYTHNGHRADCTAKC